MYIIYIGSAAREAKDYRWSWDMRGGIMCMKVITSHISIGWS